MEAPDPRDALILTLQNKLGERDEQIASLHNIIGDGCEAHDKRIADLQSRLDGAHARIQELGLKIDSQRLENMGLTRELGLVESSLTALDKWNAECGRRLTASEGRLEQAVNALKIADAAIQIASGPSLAYYVKQTYPDVGKFIESLVEKLCSNPVEDTQGYQNCATCGKPMADHA